MIIIQLNSEQLSSLIETVVRKVSAETQPYQPTSDEWLNLEQLCSFLPDKPAKSTVYTWVHKKLIPFHKQSKALSFLMAEITDWLKQGRKKTEEELSKEISCENDIFLSKKKSRTVKKVMVKGHDSSK